MVAGNARVLKDIPPFMLVDVKGHIAGVNVVGMRRAGFATQQREEVKRAHRTLHRSGTGFTSAIAQLEEAVQTRVGQEILTFVRSESKRGFAQGSRDGRVQEV
jgi:UDP-N-acetylglucosamine acyltransferase